MNEHFFIYDDRFYSAGTPVISAGNRGLRYADGLFETMRMYQGKILLQDFHFERLMIGLRLLQFEIPETFNSLFLIKKINALVAKNQPGKNAGIRLMVFRGEGRILDNDNNLLHYIIETWPLSEKIEWNDNGLVVDIFPDARKSCDLFSGIKSNNYLPYAMAGLFAKKNKLDEAFILNTNGRICESAIANIFIIKGKNIYTPPLSEGCVAGVMRRWLLEKDNLKNYTFLEKELSVEDILDADELFLTNSVKMLTWVRDFSGKIYTHKRSFKIFQQILEVIKDHEGLQLPGR